MVKTLRIDRVIAALAILLFVTFATATLAHDLAPVGPLAQLELGDCLKRSPLQIDPIDQTVAVPFDTCHVPRGSSCDLLAQRDSGAKFVRPLPSRIPAHARAGKVSVHVYDAVLLL
jgi:hypothetical protein